MESKGREGIEVNRDRDLEAFEGKEYDLVVIGGGIVGCGIARDASIRGMDVCIVEKDDFGAGTTSKSTRLIHGGLRYLEMFDFGLVFESLQERSILREIAPHLVEPLRFLIPSYGDSFLHRAKIRVGLWLYDLLSYGKELPNHGVLSPNEVNEEDPELPMEELQEAFTYYDCQAEFIERLCVENILSAVKNGAKILNHTEFKNFKTEEGRIEAIEVEKKLSGDKVKIEGKIFINSSGPWASRILGGMEERDLVRPTKGIHLVIPKITENGVLLPTEDGRIIFVVPWNGKSLVGTTDTDFREDPDLAEATENDIDYLLGELNRYFPEIEEKDIIYTYAGVRPLYNSGDSAKESDVSRKHKIEDHEELNIISVLGAKITNYRVAAEEATDLAAEKLGVKEECITAERKLPGGEEIEKADFDIPEETLEHLKDLYGSRYRKVAEIAEDSQSMGEKLCSHTEDIKAQIKLAVEEELAVKVCDFMLRRGTVGWEKCRGRCCVEKVSSLMAKLLGWSQKREKKEIEKYLNQVD